MLETIKNKPATIPTLPVLCSTLYEQFSMKSFPICKQVILSFKDITPDPDVKAAVNDLREWAYQGCWKYTIYKSRSWINPCPAHVLCSQLKDSGDEPFCTEPPMEEPFNEER